MSLARSILRESYYVGEYLPHYQTLKAISEGTIEENESEVEPVISTKESKENYKVEFSVPGLKREDLLVAINDNGSLCIVTMKYKECEIEEAIPVKAVVETTHKEIPLPAYVDTSFNSAYCSKGKLSIFFTKSEQPITNRPSTIMVY